MSNHYLLSLALGAILSLAGGTAWGASYTRTVEATTGTGIIQFSELDLSKITCFDDNGKTKVRANQTTLGSVLVMKGTRYMSGVGTHAPSKAVIDLKGATTFHTLLGVDDDASSAADHGIVEYKVTVYKDKASEVKASGTVYRTDSELRTLDLDVSDYDYLVLEYNTGAQAWADQVAWADARFTYSGTAPTVVSESEMYSGTSNPSVIYLPTAGPNGEEIVALSSMELSKITNGWGTIVADRSIGGNSLQLKGKTYASGVGAHATAKINVKLNGAVTAFHAVIGIDDETRTAAQTSSIHGVCDYSVTLVAQNGEQVVISSGTIRALDADPVYVDITENLRDYKYLILEFPEGDSDANDHVDIANAYFEYVEQNSTRPAIVSDDEMSATLNCATRVFAQPGVRFMHKLRSGDSSAQISVTGLPEGLYWNDERNLVDGIVEQPGEYTYSAVVTSSEGTTITPITLTVSSELDQPVPFMGWLSWNVVQGDISETVVRTVSDAFVSQGLLDAGYNYLVIDDLWHANWRGSGSVPAADSNKFPNGIKAAADYAHSKGLKFGIYSDAGSYTCGGKFGSYGYEAIDANTYASWGVDLLKYDYCDAPDDLASCKARYQAMGNALKNSGRKIVFYMCEWGVREPWKWASETGSSCWRATYDTRDGWNGKNGGIGMVQSVAGMKDLWPYCGVNRFNDADMMCVGIHGTGKSSNDLVDGTPGMTQDEYRSQFAMWCMWSSPLTLSFDLRKSISEEDLAIMTNSELIAIDQDRMCQAAEFVSENADGCQLYFKDLENGDVAVAVINMSSSSHPYTVNFSAIPALEIGETYYVRNLQDRTDEPNATNVIEIPEIRSHETKVYRLSQANVASVESPSEVVSSMTVSTDDNSVTVCLPGTGDAVKRVLVSDTEGRIVASTTSEEECINIPMTCGHGIYIVNLACAARSHSAKISF